MRWAKTSAPSVIGSIITNSTRQDQWSTMKPDRVGPIAGAKEITRPKVPIAVPRRWIGKIAKRIVCISGMIMPPLAACTTRPTRSTAYTGATAQMSVPSAKMPIAAKNIVRVENFWIRNAVAGIMIPLTSMNSVVTHWAAFAVMPKSAMNAGSAVFSSVWFRMMTKAPASSTAITMFGFTCAGAGPPEPAVLLFVSPLTAGTSLVWIATWPLSARPRSTRSAVAAASSTVGRKLH